MDYKKISETLVDIYTQWTTLLQDASTYYQLLLVLAIFLFSYLISRRIRKHVPLFSQREVRILNGKKSQLKKSFFIFSPQSPRRCHPGSP